MSSKFNYFAPKKYNAAFPKIIPVHIYTLHKIFECLKDGRMIWLCKRGSQTCSIKFLRQMTIETEFGNLHFFVFEIKGYFAKKLFRVQLFKIPIDRLARLD